jgi:transposase
MMFPNTLRVFVATKPIDLRVSFDRLAGIVREQFGDDPRSGALFFFTNKASDRCKILFHDPTGYCLLYKRMDAGTFQLPVPKDSADARVLLTSEVFARLLEGIADEVDASSGKRIRRRIH